MNNLLKNLRSDFSASIVVFFVAVPLCLGIALASGAPLFAGIIAGIVGGIIVGAASGSQLGVSGPAAGLAVIVLGSIASLGGWETFLLAVILAGVLQIVLGYLKLGNIGYYFPSSVIKGMLTGIGLLIILKQIPHAFGYDQDFEGDDSFVQPDGQNTFTEILTTFDFINFGAVFISLISLGILILWDKVLMKKHKIFGMINGPFVAVMMGILLNYLFQLKVLPFSLTNKQIVQVPVATSIKTFFQQFSVPDFSQLSNPKVYTVALVLAIVASLETLLSVEAADRLDPEKRITPTNRELKAQGLGNIVSGLLGGLPVTQVIVRSSANVAFGAKSKLSAILHGIFLLMSAVLIPQLLNMIPLATLASILFVVGYKLAKPAIFKQVYKQGWEQFVPFVVTIVAMVFTDLLKGIAVGTCTAIFFLLRNNFRNPYKMSTEGDLTKIELPEELSFFNKGRILEVLNKIPDNSNVLIDATKTRNIHYDVREVFRDFQIHAQVANIKLELKGIEVKDMPKNMGH